MRKEKEHEKERGEVTGRHHPNVCIPQCQLVTRRTFMEPNVWKLMKLERFQHPLDKRYRNKRIGPDHTQMQGCQSKWNRKYEVIRDLWSSFGFVKVCYAYYPTTLRFHILDHGR